jgi:hypothetical protein
MPGVHGQAVANKVESGRLFYVRFKLTIPSRKILTLLRQKHRRCTSKCKARTIIHHGESVYWNGSSSKNFQFALTLTILILATCTRTYNFQNTFMNTSLITTNTRIITSC